MRLIVYGDSVYGDTTTIMATTTIDDDDGVPPLEDAFGDLLSFAIIANEPQHAHHNERGRYFGHKAHIGTSYKMSCTLANNGQIVSSSVSVLSYQRRI